MMLCRRCGKREATTDIGPVLDVRWRAPSCERCVVEVQLEHARERAAAIPGLEAKLGEIVCRRGRGRAWLSSLAVRRWTATCSSSFASRTASRASLGPPTDTEIRAHDEFMALRFVRIGNLETFAWQVAGRPLRRAVGQDVRVGGHRPPPGGPEIPKRLEDLLSEIEGSVMTPFDAHVEYELLHPFMDGNGRSGRVLWAWMMCRQGADPFALPFLHAWYYQSLDAGRSR